MNDLLNVIQSGNLGPNTCIEEEASKNEELPSGFIKQEDEKDKISEDIVNYRVKRKGRIIDTINLNNWFKKNKDIVGEVRLIRYSVAQVDPDDSLLFSRPHPKGGEIFGRPRKEILLFNDAKQYIIFDAPGLDVKLLGNKLYLLHDLDDGKMVKCYSTKGNLISFFCIDIDGIPVPYSKVSLKLEHERKTYRIVETEPSRIISSFSKELTKVNFEYLSINYPKFKKSEHNFTTIGQVIKYFNEISKGVIEYGHLLKIDEISTVLIQYSIK